MDQVRVTARTWFRRDGIDMAQQTTERTGAASLPSAPLPPAGGRGGITQRIAVWSATHRWTAIGVWALMIVLFAGITAVLSPREATSLDLGVGESGRAAQTATDAGHPDPAVENALITSRAGALEEHEADAAAHTLVTRLGKLDEVASVATTRSARSRRSSRRSRRTTRRCGSRRPA
jgi:RND superfamily putative drug exporter